MTPPLAAARVTLRRSCPQARRWNRLSVAGCSCANSRVNHQPRPGGDRCDLPSARTAAARSRYRSAGCSRRQPAYRDERADTRRMVRGEPEPTMPPTDTPQNATVSRPSRRGERSHRHRARQPHTGPGGRGRFTEPAIGRRGSVPIAERVLRIPHRRDVPSALLMTSGVGHGRDPTSTRPPRSWRQAGSAIASWARLMSSSIELSVPRPRC